MQRFPIWRRLGPFVVVILASIGHDVLAAPLPVYGSPGFTPGVGGYIANIGSVDFINESIAVNNVGVAVARANRFDGAGNSPDSRALRWSATSADVLGDLGTSGGIGHTNVQAINNSGVAIGFAAAGFGASTAVRWTVPGTAPVPVPTPAGFSGAILQDVNNSGTMLGMGDLSGGTRPFRWSAAGTPTPLQSLPAYANTEAYDINDAGAAVGRAFNGFDDRAVRWDAAATITELGHLGLDAEARTVVSTTALNSDGTAVGYAFKHDAAGKYQGTVPVRWDAESTTAVELDTLTPGPSGDRFGYARSVNDSGVAIGYVQKVPTFPTDEFGVRAARWDAADTAVTVLGTLGTAPNGEAFTDAFAINSAGLITGTATKYNAETGLSELRAVIWGAAGVAVDLNTLIAPTSGWLLTHAYAVSDTGWIAGDGLFDPDGPGGADRYGRHFLLHVPEPAPSLFGVSAILLILGRRAGRRAGFGASGGATHI